MAKETKISGEITGITDGDYRAIFPDCGGAIWIYDIILTNCLQFKEGDRVTITISPNDNEFHYPPSPELSHIP